MHAADRFGGDPGRASVPYDETFGNSERRKIRRSDNLGHRSASKVRQLSDAMKMVFLLNADGTQIPLNGELNRSLLVERAAGKAVLFSYKSFLT